MPWKYPRLTRNSPRKLALILCMEIVFITATLLVAIHCTWRFERWRLLNQHELEWQLGLFRNWASANCDALNEPSFHAVCMAVFKHTFGTVKEVRDMICGLTYAQIKIEPEFLDDARTFASSCKDIEKIYNISLTAFIMFVFAAIFSALVFYLALRLAYKQFNRDQRVLYWLSFSFQLLTCFLILIPLIMYPLTVNDTLPALFHYVNDADPAGSPIQQIHGGGTWGVGFILAWVLFVLDVIITVLLFFWLPIAQEEVQIVKKSATKKKKGEQAQLLGQAPPPSSKSSFWAYMPEVFQPDVYVAEYGGPQMIGYGEPQSMTTVTRTITDGRPPEIDPYTGLPITDGRQAYVDSYSYMH